MATTDKTKLLHQFLDRLKGKVEPATFVCAAGEVKEQTADCCGCACHGDFVLRELVRSFLVWESTSGKAEAALKKIDASCVDINEFRVCLPDEMAVIVGLSYPHIEERVVRLRAALNDLFKREQRLGLKHIKEMPKKQAAGYLAGLAQIPQFVADRVGLVSMGIHAVPVDQRIALRLTEAKIIDEATTPEDASDALSRMVKAGEALGAYALLQAWADANAASHGKVVKAAAKATGGPRRK